MYTHGYQLKTEVDFDNAILFGTIVSITQDGEHVGSGRLLSQSRLEVTTITAILPKDKCKFNVCAMTIPKNKLHNRL